MIAPYKGGIYKLRTLVYTPSDTLGLSHRLRLKIRLSFVSTIEINLLRAYNPRFPLRLFEEGPSRVPLSGGAVVLASLALKCCVVVVRERVCGSGVVAVMAGGAL